MKRLFFRLLLLVLLLVGVGLSLPFLLSSDTLRQEFSNRVSSISDMDIALGGPVSFSIYPDLGLVAKDVKLAAPDGNFSASVGKIVGSVNLTTIFSDKIEITGLSLHSPEISIVESPDAKATEEPQESNDNSDPLASAIGQLERLSLSRLSIRNGRFVSQAADGSQTIVSDIDADLRAPSLDGEINVILSALRDGQRVSLTATLAALRPILQRQPTKLDFTLKMDPAPHPVVADLTASGVILLAEDGSYQISDGVFTSLGQPLRLDALYRPGERPYGSISLQAEKVDLGAFQSTPQKNDAAQKNSANKPGGEAPDLSALAGFDADISVKIANLVMDNVAVRAIDLNTKLKDGTLQVSLGNATVANGTIATELSADLNDGEPVVRGNLTASSFKITDLTRLAAVQAPMSGTMGLNVGYAFRGLSQAAIKNSFNLAGTVNLSNGKITVPALGELGLGESAKTISSINLEATIENVQKPIDLKGQLVWNGETIKLGSLVSPRSFIQNNAGRLTVSVDSKKFSVDYTGNVGLNGSAKGRLKFSTSSLGNLMAWVGQGSNDDLKGLSYAGNINVDQSNFSFNGAKIALNNINATGSGSFKTTGKPTITTNLSFGTLDLAAFTGGGSASSKSSKGGGSADTPIDLSPLRSFDANIKLAARSLGYGKVKAGPVRTSLIVKNGVARLQLPKTPFYGGTVTADITADGSGKLAAIKINSNMSAIDALPLFSDAADFKRLEGKLNAKIDIHGSGQTSKQFAKSLKGSTSAKFADGAIRGIDIAKIYNNLTSVLATGFKENQGDKTTFTAMGLSFAIDKGVATTNDIQLLGPLVRMDGAGQVDLGEETIDIKLNPKIVGSLSGQGGEFDVGGAGIPVIIKGPLNNPKVYPDLQELLKNPQAALDALSKLGVNIKGLGDGKIDINKIASEKLKLDKLGLENVDLKKLTGKNSKEEATKVIGNLVAKRLGTNNGGGSSNNASGTEKIVGGLVGSLLGSQGQKVASATPNQPPAASNGNDGGTLAVTGRIPVPTPNPRRRAAADTAPKTVEQTIQKQVVDQVVPKLKLPGDDEATKKTFNNLLNNILE